MIARGYEIAPPTLIEDDLKDQIFNVSSIRYVRMFMKFKESKRLEYQKSNSSHKMARIKGLTKIIHLFVKHGAGKRLGKLRSTI